MKFISTTLLILACALNKSFAATEDCKTVTVQQDFDYDTYVSKPWHIQMQMVTAFNPPSSLFCIRARFRTRTEPKNGYPIGVITEKREGSVTGELSPNDSCVFNTDASDPAKLALVKCDLPKQAAGDYWIVRYNEEEGYALISGGQPTIPSGKDDGLCQTGAGINQSGLWIFTRKQERDEKLVEKVTKIAEEAGFDPSVLKFVDQDGCDYTKSDTFNPDTGDYDSKKEEL